MINFSLSIVTFPSFTVIKAISLLSFVKYKKGIPIPDVAVKSCPTSFQFKLTVQSEKSETLAALAFKSETPTTTGKILSITPQGI